MLAILKGSEIASIGSCGFIVNVSSTFVISNALIMGIKVIIIKLHQFFGLVIRIQFATFTPLRLNQLADEPKCSFPDIFSLFIEAHRLPSTELIDWRRN